MDGSQVFGKQCLLGILLYAFPVFSLDRSCICNDTLYGIEFLEQLGSCFRADTGHPGDIIHTVALQSQQVSDLVHLFDLPGVENFLFA